MVAGRFAHAAPHDCVMTFLPSFSRHFPTYLSKHTSWSFLYSVSASINVFPLGSNWRISSNALSVYGFTHGCTSYLLSLIGTWAPLDQGPNPIYPPYPRTYPTAWHNFYYVNECWLAWWAVTKWCWYCTWNEDSRCMYWLHSSKTPLEKEERGSFITCPWVVHLDVASASSAFLIPAQAFCLPTSPRGPLLSLILTSEHTTLLLFPQQWLINISLTSFFYSFSFYPLLERCVDF